jgi:hypothetical protein
LAASRLTSLPFGFAPAPSGSMTARTCVLGVRGPLVDRDVGVALDRLPARCPAETPPKRVNPCVARCLIPVIACSARGIAVNAGELSGSCLADDGRVGAPVITTVRWVAAGSLSSVFSGQRYIRLNPSEIAGGTRAAYNLLKPLAPHPGDHRGPPATQSLAGFFVSSVSAVRARF